MQSRLTDALNAREAALRVFDQTIWSRYKSHVAHQQQVAHADVKLAERRAVETLAIDLQMLKEAACFVWAPDLVAAVAQSATTLPDDVAFDRSWLHAPSGFWWFGPESPLRAKAVDDEHGETRETTVHAIAYAWRPERSAVIVEAMTLDTWDLPSELGVCGVRPFYGEQWGVGMPLTSMYHDVSKLHRVAVEEAWNVPEVRRRGLEIYMMNAHTLLPFFAAAGLWLSQRICVDQPEHVERHARKRAEKVGMNPDVRVVRLRRADYRAAAEREATEAGADGRVFSVQWVVRGHWRNQWYRTAQAHRPIWIDPYTKGPEGAPLKPSTTIFAVDR